MRHAGLRPAGARRSVRAYPARRAIASAARAAARAFAGGYSRPSLTRWTSVFEKSSPLNSSGSPETAARA